MNFANVLHKYHLYNQIIMTLQEKVYMYLVYYSGVYVSCLLFDMMVRVDIFNAEYVEILFKLLFVPLIFKKL